MRCPAFESLINDMNAHNIEKEHYSFNYNGFQFDVILSITHNGYELLVAVHTHNWGCVLTMNQNYNIEVPNDVYYSLCNLLHLNWNIHHFGSATFLRLLSEKAPNKSSCQGVNYEMLIDYLPYRHVDEKDKIYFCGWNDHTKDKRKAKNFDKTEFYFGKTVAEYCRKNNISSMWSDIPRNAQKPKNPWDK